MELRLPRACSPSLMCSPAVLYNSPAQTADPIQRGLSVVPPSQAWHCGHALARRYSCTPRPLSYGVVMGIEHFGGVAAAGETAEGVRERCAVAFLPKNMVEGPLWSVIGGKVLAQQKRQRHRKRWASTGEFDVGVDSSPTDHLELVRADAYEPTGKTDGDSAERTGLWRNRLLARLVDEGQVILVPDDERGRRCDDVAIIRFAKDTGALILSNDVFRDHRRSCTKMNRRTGDFGAGAANTLGFGTRKEFARFMKERRVPFDVVVHGPPADMYPAGHPLRVAAELDNLESLPDIFCSLSPTMSIMSLVPDR